MKPIKNLSKKEQAHIILRNVNIGIEEKYGKFILSYLAAAGQRTVELNTLDELIAFVKGYTDGLGGEYWTDDNFK